jgi:HEAT repeat protein
VLAVVAGLALWMQPVRSGVLADEEPAQPKVPVAAVPQAPPAPTVADTLPYGMRWLDAPAGTSRDLIRGALQWLARTQQSDGSWLAPGQGADRDIRIVGVSALAVLAFLGAGQGPDAPERHAATVAKGLTFLRSKLDAEGYVPRTAQHYMYAQAFTTLALVEAAAMTGEPALTADAQRALDACALARNPYFAWRYGVKTGDNDTSVSACVWSAFQAAHWANEVASSLSLPLAPLFVLDSEAADGMHAWLLKMTDVEYGRLGYISRGQGPGRSPEDAARFPAIESESLTAAGVWIRNANGWDPELVQKGLRLVTALLPRWEPGCVDYYYWYYGSLAVSAFDTPECRAWSSALERNLEAGAEREGQEVHWPLWDPWSSEGGAVYATAMAALALEGSRRYGGRAKGSDLVAYVRQTNGDAGLYVRILRALALRGDPESGNAAAAALAGKNPKLRRAAAAHLRSAWPLTAQGPALEAAARDADPEVASVAVRLLGLVGRSALPTIRAALDHPAASVRSAACDALGPSLGDGPAGERVRALLTDPDAIVRLAAARALAHLAGDAAAALAVLVPALQVEDVALRMRAARSLADLGPVAAPAASALEARLEDPSLDVRLEVALALATLRGHGAPRGAPFSASPWEQDQRERERSLSLATPGPVAGWMTPVLVAGLGSADREMRLRCVLALGRIGREARDAVPALDDLAVQDDQHVAKAAVAARALVDGTTPTAVKRVAVPPDVPAMREILLSPVKAGAVRAGGLEATPRAGALLAPLLADPDPLVRLRATELLGDAAKKAKAFPAALAPLVKDPDARVRVATLVALVRIDPGSPATTESIEAGLADVDPRVFAAALSAACARAGPPLAIAACVKAAVGVSPGNALRALEAFGRWKPSLAGAAWDGIADGPGRSASTLSVRLAALRCLGVAAPASWPTIDVLLLAISSHAPAIWEAGGTALDALGKRDFKLAELAVARWSTSAPDEVRRIAPAVSRAGTWAASLLLALLKGADTPRTLQILGMLSDDALALKTRAVLAAAPSGTKEIASALGHRYRGFPRALGPVMLDADPQVRLAAARVAKETLSAASWAVDPKDRQALWEAVGNALAVEADPFVQDALTAARAAWKRPAK